MKRELTNLGNFVEGIGVPRCAFPRGARFKYLFHAHTDVGGGGGAPRALSALFAHGKVQTQKNPLSERALMCRC